MFWFVAVKNLDMIYEPLANRPCCLKFPACAYLLQGLLNHGAVSGNICWAVPNFAFELWEQWCQKQFRKQHHHLGRLFFLAVAMKWTVRIFLQWQVKLLPKHQIFLACCSVRRWLFLGSQKVFLHRSHVGKSTLETPCFLDSQGMDLQIILRICLRISLQIEQMEHSGMQTWPCVVIWMLMITTNGGSLAEFARVNFSGFSLLSENQSCK